MTMNVTIDAEGNREVSDRERESEHNNNRSNEETPPVDVTDVSEKPKRQLTASQRARIERNRQKALLLRQARLSQQQLLGTTSKGSYSKVIDSGGGFLIEENPDVEPKKLKRVEEPAPPIEGEDSVCLECDKPFRDSYLMKTYSHCVCDTCRDPEDKHCVVTKTEAKETYLLSEADLVKREPALRFIVRRNPHNRRWGDMKLYLLLQIEKRALEVWGSPEALEDERERRESKRELAKKKRFQRNMKKLRQEVRSSLYEVKTKGHEHVYGPEQRCGTDDDDVYTKSCLLCGHQLTFEKM